MLYHIYHIFTCYTTYSWPLVCEVLHYHHIFMAISTWSFRSSHIHGHANDVGWPAPFLVSFSVQITPRKFFNMHFYEAVSPPNPYLPETIILLVIEHGPFSCKSCLVSLTNSTYFLCFPKINTCEIVSNATTTDILWFSF